MNNALVLLTLLYRIIKKKKITITVSFLASEKKEEFSSSIPLILGFDAKKEHLSKHMI